MTFGLSVDCVILSPFDHRRLWKELMRNTWHPDDFSYSAMTLGGKPVMLSPSLKRGWGVLIVDGYPMMEFRV